MTCAACGKRTDGSFGSFCKKCWAEAQLDDPDEMDRETDREDAQLIEEAAWENALRLLEG